MTDNGKKRISSLAKEFEVTSEVFLRLVKEAGLEAKTASSMLDAAGVQKVKPFLDAEKVVWEWPDVMGRVIEEFR